MLHGRAKGHSLLVSLLFLLSFISIPSFGSEYSDADYPPVGAQTDEAGGWQPVLRQGTVTKLSDGDTIWFHDDQQDPDTHDLRIRMVSMDAPEIQHNSKDLGQNPWGPQATDALNAVIPVGTRVTLVDFGMDKYKRTLGRIFLGRTDVNLQMVRGGWAIPYVYCEGPHCDGGFFQREHAKEYFDACEQARAEGRGVFNPENPLTEMPFEYRLRYTGREAEKYVGDFYTHALYAPTDYNAVDVCRRVFFKSKRQADALGFNDQN